MGSSLSGMFGVTNEPSDEYLQLTDLGGFLCKYIFIMLDKEKKKLVSKQEYLTLVNHFREQKTTEEELDNFLKKTLGDGKSTDYIDERVFKKLIIQLAIDFDRNIEERMRYLLTLFDKDLDGYVSESDLCEVYDTIGITVPMDPIRSLINKYDVDGDGKLSQEEFEQLGRSAMSKLFFKQVEPTPSVSSTVDVDGLVNEAIKGAGASLSLRLRKRDDEEESSGALGGEGEQDEANKLEELDTNPHVLNNNLVKDCPSAPSLTIVDDLLLGKPVVIKDSANSSSSSLVVDKTPFVVPACDCEYFGQETKVEEGNESLRASGEGELGVNSMQAQILGQLELDEEEVN